MNALGRNLWGRFRSSDFISLFSARKRFENYQLNLIGLQLFRIVVYNFKKLVVGLKYFKTYPEGSRDLSKNGFAQFKNAIADFDSVTRIEQDLLSDSRIKEYHLLGADYRELRFTSDVIRRVPA